MNTRIDSSALRAFRRGGRILFVAIVAFAAFAGFTDSNAQERPNVLLILADDLGYGDLSSYGATDLKTPHIDALMARGMRFDRFYANSTVCSPTRAALLTGRYPDVVGVPGVIRTIREENWGRLDAKATLLPALLKKAGYATAHIGKWHLGLESPDLPNERGFDYFHGWLGDMMDDYFVHRRHDINYMRRNGETIDPKEHATDLFTQWAVEYIRERQNQTEPFFLYLAYNAPHTPVQPTEASLKRVTDREPGIAPARAKIVALIEHMDDGIGQVLSALEAAGKTENTLVVFTSDNGGYLPSGASNGTLRGGKQDMYEGGIRVPAAIVWPARVPSNMITDHITMTMDLFPTILEACGERVWVPIDGQRIRLTPFEDGILPSRSLIWMRREGWMYGGRDYYAIREGAWKLLQNTPFEPMRLYNLDEDPLEERPYPDSHPMRATLSKRLQDHINATGAIPWQRDAN